VDDGRSLAPHVAGKPTGTLQRHVVRRIGHAS
jgi:hypothetical protein